LLTLLCLIFQEAADFPLNRLELYHEGLNLLLKKWDANKNIERDRLYKKLSVQQKQDLLSHIALTTFEQGKYFFKQKELEQYISDYIHNLPHVNNELEELKTNSKTVLKTIEVQHGLLVERARGIYSFSHLTFQEYFTARQIVANSYPQLLETALKQLTSRITEKRWREVFLLTGGMFRTADYLLQLMKQRIEQLVAQDEYLQAFLTWANQKSRAVNAPYKPVAIRAFYIALTFTLVLINDNVNLDTALERAGDTLELAFSLDSTFTLDRHAAIELTIDRILALVLARAIDLTFERQPTNEFMSGVNLAIKLTVEPELKREAQLSPLGKSLLSLKNQLPDLGQDKERFEQWWQVNGQAWTKQLRAVLICQRNVGHDWQFSNQQREILRHYHNANRLLLDCLNSDWYVTRAMRLHIEETLLLPVAELKQRELQA
jgi:predicted NACHT family NTPase